MKDRAGETLKKARKLNFRNRNQRVKELIGGSDDMTDIYRFRARSSAIAITAQGLSRKEDVTLYQVDQKLGPTLRRIGNQEFEELRPKQQQRFLSVLGLTPARQGKKTTYTTDIENGVYFLVVSSKAQKSEKYTLQFSASPLEVDAEPDDDMGDSPPVLSGPDTIGNTLETAKPIALRATETEAIGGNDSDDVFQFTLGDRRKVSLTLNGLVQNADITLLDSNGSTIRSASTPGVVAESLVRTLDSGTYYIQVTSDSATATAYTLVADSTTLTTKTLYTPDGSSLPESQNELIFAQLPFPPAEANIVSVETDLSLPFLQLRGLVASDNATVTVTTDGVEVDSQVNNSQEGYVGYGNYRPNYSSFDAILFSADAEPVNPAGLAVLDADVGYQLSFEVAITDEFSNDRDRAGFSILVVSSDGQRAIELGFNETGIFSQSETFDAENLITPTGFAMSDLVAYNLHVVDSSYQLFANGSPIMSGSLKQSYVFDPLASDPPLPFNPYTTPNFIFFGDNTDDANATFTLGSISVTT
ncbi:MAG: PPC domain-containing protein [Leptolyngbyaceae cyanobacterium]